MPAAAKIIQEYGWVLFLSLSAVSVIAWVFRIALKNPLEVVSGALSDVDAARKALNEELVRSHERIGRRDKHIQDLKKKVSCLEQKVQEMQQHIADLEADA